MQLIPWPIRSDRRFCYENFVVSRFFNFTHFSAFLISSSTSVGSKIYQSLQAVQSSLESAPLIRQVDFDVFDFLSLSLLSKLIPEQTLTNTIPLSLLSLHDVCRCLMFALQSSFEHSNDSLEMNFAKLPGVRPAAPNPDGNHFSARVRKRTSLFSGKTVFQSQNN